MGDVICIDSDDSDDEVVGEDPDQAFARHSRLSMLSTREIDDFVDAMNALHQQHGQLYYPSHFSSSLTRLPSGGIDLMKAHDPHREVDLSMFARLFFFSKPGPHFILNVVNLINLNASTTTKSFSIQTINPASGNTQYYEVEKKIKLYVLDRLPTFKESNDPPRRVRRPPGASQQDATSCGFSVCLYAKMLTEQNDGDLSLIPSSADEVRRQVCLFLHQNHHRYATMRQRRVHAECER
jgi:hypothetical protein